MRNATFALLIVSAVALTAAACGGGSPEPGVPAGSTPSPAANPSPAASAPASAPPQGSLYGAPAPSASKLNDIDDLSRDVRNVSERERSGIPDFTSDLPALIPTPPEKASLDAFGKSIVDAIQGHPMDLPKSRRVAELLYVALYSRELTPENRSGARQELAASLTEAGVAGNRVTADEGAFDRLAPASR